MRGDAGTLVPRMEPPAHVAGYRETGPRRTRMPSWLIFAIGMAVALLLMGVLTGGKGG